MKVSAAAAIALTVLCWAGCGTALRLPESSLALPARIRVGTTGRVVVVPLEEYVLAAALAEVTPLNESPGTIERIYEVQAVLARSYAVSHIGRHAAQGFDLCDSGHCQLYEPARLKTSRFAAAARTAAERTAGSILTYSHRPAEALFHADCGGYTAAADAVWGGLSVPYLAATRDDPPLATHRAWTRVVKADELRSALNADARSRVGSTLEGLQVRERDVSGRAIAVAVGGSRVLRGEEFRDIVNQRLGDRAIQSTRFTIRRSGETYIFEGTGFGHGVGLCQLGAVARARRGDSLESILAAYFHGAALVRTTHPPTAAPSTASQTLLH